LRKQVSASWKKPEINAISPTFFHFSTDYCSSAISNASSTLFNAIAKSNLWSASGVI